MYLASVNRECIYYRACDFTLLLHTVLTLSYLKQIFLTHFTIFIPNMSYSFSCIRQDMAADYIINELECELVSIIS